MIFDHRYLDEITDEEIDRIVKEHLAERQHLEFKERLNLGATNNPAELLRDVVSLANNGGGYLIIGIKDDGIGRAEEYKWNSTDDPEKIKNKIKSWCQDHVAERIINLEIQTRQVNGNPLVLVRVPDSAQVPHMVKFNDQTEFWRRYDDGKRLMTMSEIREAFLKDIVGRRLSSIENTLTKFIEPRKPKNKTKEILERVDPIIHDSQTLKSGDETSKVMERLRSGIYPALTLLENGEELAYVCHELFLKEKGVEKYFRVACTPLNPKSNLIDVDDPVIKKLIETPPQSRYGGWNMLTGDMAAFPIERCPEGIRRGHKDGDYLQLLSNGHMEFWAPLDETFCWKQTEEEFHLRPRLYPYAVTEYPASFFRLYHELIQAAEIHDGFLLELEYRNLKEYALAAYRPGTYGFITRGLKDTVYPGEHYEDSIRVSNDFNPDQATYRLLKAFYGTFSYEEKVIPFYDRDEEKFVFE